MTKDPTFNMNHDKGYVTYENISQTDEIIIVFDNKSIVILPKTVTKSVSFTGKKNYNIKDGRPGEFANSVEPQQGGKVEITLDRVMLDTLKVVRIDDNLGVSDLIDANTLEDVFSDNEVLAISLGFINGFEIDIAFLTNNQIENLKSVSKQFSKTNTAMVEGNVEKEVLMTKDIVVFSVSQ